MENLEPRPKSWEEKNRFPKWGEVLSANPLSISSAISFQDSVSNFWFERNFLESLFFAQMDWTEPSLSLKEADVNLSKVQPTPHRFECPAYFNIWLFDISTIVLIIFTTI